MISIISVVASILQRLSLIEVTLRQLRSGPPSRTEKVVVNVNSLGSYELSTDAKMKYVMYSSQDLYYDSKHDVLRHKNDETVFEISRWDSTLVQIVEEMGRKAQGDNTNLQILNINIPYHCEPRITTVPGTGYEFVEFI